MRTVAIIQAREGSQRLPGKVLAHIDGISVIEHVYRRVHAAVFAVVACPIGDQRLVNECVTHDLQVIPFAGDPDDVLGRFRWVARVVKADVIVRITADCPFVQTDVVAAAASLAQQGAYVIANPTTGWPDGLDVEAFPVEMLMLQCRDREHVTRGCTPDITINRDDLSHIRLTLDTADDLARLRAIARRIDCCPPHRPTVEELLRAYPTR